MGATRPRLSESIVPIEAEIDPRVLSRRDFYLGLWAGRQFGLSDRALHDYAQSLVETDRMGGDPEAIITKLERDFLARGWRMAREEIEHQICRTAAVAHRQFGVPQTN